MAGRPPAAPESTAGTLVRVTTPTSDATRELGARLGRSARPGAVVALYGELGAGKTCLVQGIAAGLGVHGPVTSPTFVLIAEYPGRLPLYHVDLYRPDDVEHLGLEELFDGEGVTVVEWAERAEALLPARAIRVRIRGVGDEPRVIEIAGLPPGWESAAA